jgi:hypothetical protein
VQSSHAQIELRENFLSGVGVEQFSLTECADFPLRHPNAIEVACATTIEVKPTLWAIDIARSGIFAACGAVTEWSGLWLCIGHAGHGFEKAVYAHPNGMTDHGDRD